MEFRKEGRVEVWCKKRVAWRLAEVLSSDGNHLFIRYEDHPCSGDIAAPRKVLKQMVRPLQPAVTFIGSVKVDDVVEVLDLCSWNAAIVLRVISEWFYLVRLLGSCEEVNVSRANIRVHQAWEKCAGRTLVKVHGPRMFGTWKNQNSLIRYENLSCDVISCESRTSIKMKDDVRACLPDGKAEGSPLVPQRRLKRLSPNSLSSLEANSCCFHKRQATGTQSELLKLETGQLFRPLEREFLEKAALFSGTIIGSSLYLLPKDLMVELQGIVIIKIPEGLLPTNKGSINSSIFIWTDCPFHIHYSSDKVMTVLAGHDFKKPS
ncbi:hypothetical protein MLD38_015225 [Melastoma candidum]|uniref:Uncharacterized protein n=1 Tax=Melastoma candidum TaxID=119954 RepID=A0ACB9RJL3_9MYRT|nr:hypothetical protein MLD38_015225 [Melastoma candidum]